MRVHIAHCGKNAFGVSADFEMERVAKTPVRCAFDGSLVGWSETIDDRCITVRTRHQITSPVGAHCLEIPGLWIFLKVELQKVSQSSTVSEQKTLSKAEV
jgi:hypothetical protein